MTEEKKQSNEEITKAGAVELEENALDEAAGGASPVDAVSWKLDPVAPVANKFDPVGIKFNPVGSKF